MTDTPETFDLDAWLSGASRPQRSVRIYQRGDMLAELDELGREIELAEAAGDAERSLTDASPAALRQRYAELSEKFAASSMTVRVQSATIEEELEIIGDRDRRTNGPAINRDLVYAALIEPKMTREQFDRFVDSIGAYQWGKVVNTYTVACGAKAEPSADFLPQFSTATESE